MPTDSPVSLNPFLKNVHLKGFKSIIDLSTYFEPGLNILIGKNASGKSNFLEFLNVVTELLGEGRILYNYAKLEYNLPDNQFLNLKFEKEVNTRELDIEDRIILNEKLYLNDEELIDTSSENAEKKRVKYNRRTVTIGSNIRNTLRRMGLRQTLRPLYIKFNIPSTLECLNASGNIKIDINDEFSIWDMPKTLGFLTDIFGQLENSADDDIDTIKKLDKKNILKQLKFKKEIINNLKKYTPIRDIRFSDNVNIYHNDKSVSIENLKIDFKLNNSWIPWSQLSDGTKRLLYIVAEITNKENGLILVEEPELGIHPHQFNLVMEFLKEESVKKQIIVSTHSPYTLNHLGPDELGNILITYYDEKKGTQIRHLTEQQIKKAQKYMEEVGFFSDYWMLSDLE